MHARFTLEIIDGVGPRATARQVASPVLLPPACVPARPGAVHALVNDLRELGIAVEPAPPAIRVGARVLYPQLALTDRGARWCVELIGFSTSDSLADKLARYRDAGCPVVLCVEQAFAPGCDLALGVCSFTHQVDARDVLAMVRA
jgi:predicted nuclease of restriction endonuclease-like RecB superfamily